MTIRISIGTEPAQWLPCEVLKFSIRRRTTESVEFTESWSPSQGWHPAMKNAPPLRQGTKFSAWRWLVPTVYGHQGRAIYLDADMACCVDIAELWNTDLEDYLFAAVCNSPGFIGPHGAPQAGACQTSLMLMDCSRCNWNYSALVDQVNKGTLKPETGRRLDPHYAKKGKTRVAYGVLQQAAWIPLSKIKELDPHWNSMNVYRDGITNLYHSTHSATQEWKTGKNASEANRFWFNELRSSVKNGVISQSDISKEAQKGHISKRLVDIL